MVILAVIATILLTTIGQLCMRKFACNAGQQSFASISLIITGLCSYGLSVITYISVLRSIKIAVAFSIIFGCTSLLVSVSSNLFFKETLSITQIVGVMVIILGVSFLSIK